MDRSQYTTIILTVCLAMSAFIFLASVTPSLAKAPPALSCHSEGWIGMTLDEAVTYAKEYDLTYRLIGQDDSVTTDYIKDRVNLYLDEARKIIIDVGCG